MTVYTIIGHPLGPPPDQPNALPENARNALQENGTGNTANITIPAPTATELQNLDIIQ